MHFKPLTKLACTVDILLSSVVFIYMSFQAARPREIQEVNYSPSLGVGIRFLATPC